VVAGIVPLIRHLYSLFFYLALPFIFLRLFWRSLKEASYRENLLQRLGFGAPIDSDKLIWIHAVSAGETIAAVPVARRLLAKGYDLLLTNMTPTGRERVSALLGSDVENRYAPYDTPGALARFLRRTKPVALIIIDTELWPNMLHYASARGVKTILVNGRLSEKSARGYGKISSLSRPMMEALFRVAAQSETQGTRFVALGLDPQRLLITGSTKFDVEHEGYPNAVSDFLSPGLRNRFVLVAASTHPGEESLVLSVLDQLKIHIPEILLVLAPRHPHRADAIFKECVQQNFTTQKHSDGNVCAESTSIYLLDTMGELMAFYGMANVAFVGGSLVPVGGHNPMEPASFGVPVLMGPYLRNVQDIAQQFIDEGAMKLVSSGDEFGNEIRLIYESKSEMAIRTEATKRVMERNKGALDRVEQMIVEALGT